MTALVYSNPPAFSPDAHQSLLVLDVFPNYERVFKRLFSHAFSDVIAVSNVADAEEILAREHVSHIVISARISEEFPLSDLIAQWKNKFPHVLRFVFFTGGSHRDFQDGTLFDAILKKPADKEEMFKAVLGEAAD